MSKLGPRDRERLGNLEILNTRVQHLHSLVERFAAERMDVTPHINALRRSFTQLKLESSGMGFDNMSQLCGSMDTAARRGGSKPFKSRILREGVASLRFLLEVEERSIRSHAKDGSARDARTDTTDDSG
jgi:hypothetical protein